MNSISMPKGEKRRHVDEGGDGSPIAKARSSSTLRQIPTAKTQSSTTLLQTPTAERVDGSAALKDQTSSTSGQIRPADGQSPTVEQHSPSTSGKVPLTKKEGLTSLGGPTAIQKQTPSTRGQAPSVRGAVSLIGVPNSSSNGLTPEMTRNFHSYANVLLELATLIKSKQNKTEEEQRKVNLLVALEKRLQSEGVDIPASLRRGPPVPASIETRLLQLLKSHFQYENFRGNQVEIMKTLLCGYDVYVCKPTGGGKSMIYFLPVLLTKKCAIIISPLIALIHDQHEKLKSAKIPTKVLDQTVNEEEKMAIMGQLQQEDNQTRIIILTPEQFTKSRFINTLIKMYENKRLAYVAVDEAHFVK